MEVSLIILAALIAVGFVLYLHDRHGRKKAEAKGLEEPAFNEPEEQIGRAHV